MCRSAHLPSTLVIFVFFSTVDSAFLTQESLVFFVVDGFCLVNNSLSKSIFKLISRGLLVFVFVWFRSDAGKLRLSREMFAFEQCSLPLDSN